MGAHVDDMEKFKYDYPEVYAKFLEMNRALAKIQRKLSREENESSFPVSTEEFTGKDEADDGLYLKLD